MARPVFDDAVPPGPAVVSAQAPRCVPAQRAARPGGRFRGAAAKHRAAGRARRGPLGGDDVLTAIDPHRLRRPPERDALGGRAARTDGRPALERWLMGMSALSRAGRRGPPPPMRSLHVARREVWSVAPSTSAGILRRASPSARDPGVRRAAAAGRHHRAMVLPDTTSDSTAAPSSGSATTPAPSSRSPAARASASPRRPERCLPLGRRHRGGAARSVPPAGRGRAPCAAAGRPPASPAPARSVITADAPVSAGYGAAAARGAHAAPAQQVPAAAAMAGRLLKRTA